MDNSPILPHLYLCAPYPSSRFPLSITNSCTPTIHNILIQTHQNLDKYTYQKIFTYTHTIFTQLTSIDIHTIYRREGKEEKWINCSINIKNKCTYSWAYIQRNTQRGVEKMKEKYERDSEIGNVRRENRQVLSFPTIFSSKLASSSTSTLNQPQEIPVRKSLKT